MEIGIPKSSERESRRIGVHFGRGDVGLATEVQGANPTCAGAESRKVRPPVLTAMG